MHINISKVNFKSISINIAKVDFGRYDSGGSEYYGMYVTPADANAISVTPNDNYYALHGKYLKYSLNGKTWNDWNGSVTIEPEQKMYLKGEDDYVWNSSTSGKLITSNGSYNVGGDISSLTNEIIEVNEYTFKELFLNDNYIKDASNLLLPATTLASNCYYSMFYGCISLTTAPVLPATTLADNCYSHMFDGCTSLTTATELPATTLANSCYYFMFHGCTSLTTAPALPATTLANGCYTSMFEGCNLLTTAPELPATTLTDYCYSSMFSGCYSLTTAPALPATTLAKDCYAQMFYYCISLTTVPELPATTLAENCYSNMFNGCSALTTATELPATTLADYCYNNMFSNCSSLTTVPALPATELYYSSYEYMFYGCVSLTTAPEIHATTLALNCCSHMFEGCTSLTVAPELPATTLTYGCYSSMFLRCTSLTTAPELPATELADYCYMEMFNGCTSLTTAPELHATTLAYGCYVKMFWDCTSLTTAPELPATTLKDYCYSSMFQDCTSLNNITMLATDISANGCLTNWVSGVAPTGTFTKAVSMTTLPTGTSGIPEGWTVKNYGVVDYSKEYMTLSALGEGEITITIPAAINSSYATSLSYSKDKANWNETIIDDTAQTISIHVTSGDNVYLKGIAKQLSNGSSNYVNINSTANINASGNIMSLLYGDDYKDKVAFPSRSQYAFGRLFKNNTHLINADELILSATTLATYCYVGMFQGCTSLTTAPELPATTLTDYCYTSMFYGCTSLNTAPELPSTTTSYLCYCEMFYECSSLTTSPELHATTLTSRCYESMFYGCTSLNSITMLATDISASGCLSSWVSGVSSTGTFTKAAEMTSLPTGASGIPEGWTVKNYGDVDYSQEYMTLSALEDGEITITIPAEIKSTYATSLSYSKDKATWTDTIIDDTEQTITIPVTNGENIYLKGIAKQIGIIRAGVNINSTANINASGNTMSLLYGDDYKDKVAFPEGSKYTFAYLFKGNTKLINAENIILPATTLAINCYAGMFQGCTSLTTAPELPATTLADYCYSEMFQGCTSLTTAPELHATTLADQCYYFMFNGCSKLNSITMLATDISASNPLYIWVYGVASTGTFTKSPEMTSLPTGTSGIPSGWTVVDYVAA